MLLGGMYSGVGLLLCSLRPLDQGRMQDCTWRQIQVLQTCTCVCAVGGPASPRLGDWRLAPLWSWFAHSTGREGCMVLGQSLITHLDAEMSTSD